MEDRGRKNSQEYVAENGEKNLSAVAHEESKYLSSRVPLCAFSTVISQCTVAKVLILAGLEISWNCVYIDIIKIWNFSIFEISRKLLSFLKFM